MNILNRKFIYITNHLKHITAITYENFLKTTFHSNPRLTVDSIC